MLSNKALYEKFYKVKKYLPDMAGLSDDQLKEKNENLKLRANKGEKLEDLLPESFALVCECNRRILNLFPYDVQILGGIALFYGYIIEMATGEGKTLTATMPLYLNALSKKSTILVTANEYLAQRDAQNLRPLYSFLGMSVASCLTEEELKLAAKDPENTARKALYKSDIVYTTHGALGFDYLNNNLVKKAENRFLPEFNFVIIDEVDAALLDDASTSLVIAGSPRVQSNLYKIADYFVSTLREDEDYTLENNNIWLTKNGVKYAEHFFGIKGYYSEENFEINRHITLALRARFLLEKEEDYIVTEEGEIALLGKMTDRVLSGMKLKGGVHQALETKENLKLSQETRCVAAVTFQNLFLLFPKMAGMSGTIIEAKKEFREIYKKEIKVIPTNKKMIRKDLPCMYFKTAEEEYKAALLAIEDYHKTSRPVLVVTSSIEASEEVSYMLSQKGIAHSVLNVNNASWEAEIIKEAGRIGAVTVSTKMAGRGTDIILEDGANALGGLAVVCIGRMPSKRQERQAVGRAGRQGEHGSSRFFVSLEDDICEILGDKIYEKYIEKDEPISERKLRSLINKAQEIIEESSNEQRMISYGYDKIMKRQREIVYKTRNNLLDGNSLGDYKIKKLAKEYINSFIKSKRKINDYDKVRFVLDNLSYNLESKEKLTACKTKAALRKTLGSLEEEYFNKKKASFETEEEFYDFVRLCTLCAIDECWIEEVDYLQQLQTITAGRSTAMKNPLFEYHLEAYGSFKKMVEDIKRQTVRNIFLGMPYKDKKGNRYIVYP